ncbi:MBL fold metallo-hydrolase [Thermasporomyces composti]|nr:MBL fold metallo-hydrolase [Thermasporomyces composti]
MSADTSGWSEIGRGCYVRRYSSFDVSVGVVVGSHGLLVIDTRASLREADELLADLRRLSRAPVRWVVDTHWHFDHCFGNARFADAVIYGHETVPETLAARADEVRADLARRSPEWARDMAELTLRPPTRTFVSVATIDLGDRVVELIHPGRGHTDGDVVVRVPDADVVYVGDLVEESGPPAYGDDSYPLEWPTTLDVVAGLLTPRTAVVPGHGAVVDRGFVANQRDDIHLVAQTIRRLAAEGVPLDRVWDAAEWPYPRQVLEEAVRRGYAHLAESGGPTATRPVQPGGRTSLPLLPRDDHS